MRNFLFTAATTAILLVSILAAQAETTSHSTHDHGDEASSQEASHTTSSHESHEGEHFEAAAVYDVEAGNNSFIAIPAEGAFEEESLAFMIVSAASADEEGLEGAEEDAEAAWDAFLDGAEPTVLAPGDSSTPSADVVYQIALEDQVVVVPVEVVAAGAYAVFLEHGADEVATALVSPSGVVLVAAAEEGGEGEEGEEETASATASQWANALLASLIVSACSFTGILVVMNKRVAHVISLSHAFIFASGALLAASLLHIIPEAMEGLESQYDSLHDLALYAGLTVLAGMTFGMVIHALLDTGHSHGQPETPSEMSLSHQNLQELIASRKGRSLLDLKGLQPVCWNVIAGDLVHNFADGVTIGAAFLSCSTTMGWTVTASAVLHEIPHELADFMALLNGGMSVKQAFAYNFLSATSAILGTVIILALGSTLSDAQISIILLLGAGSFIFIALSELLPEALHVTDATSKHGGSAVMSSQLRKLASFLVGGIVIGIPLMFDEHCSVGGDGHDH
ncbi:unnamed protein product [Pylaiella littoralis]